MIRPNDDGCEKNLRVGPRLALKIRADDVKLADKIRQINNIPGTPHNARKMVTTMHTHCEGSISPLPYLTLHTSESDVVVEMADGLSKQAEHELKQQLRQVTIEVGVSTTIVDTGASVSWVKPANKQPTISIRMWLFPMAGPIIHRNLDQIIKGIPNGTRTCRKCSRRQPSQPTSTERGNRGSYSTWSQTQPAQYEQTSKGGIRIPI